MKREGLEFRGSKIHTNYRVEGYHRGDVVVEEGLRGGRIVDSVKVGVAREDDMHEWKSFAISWCHSVTLPGGRARRQSITSENGARGKNCRRTNGNLQKPVNGGMKDEIPNRNKTSKKAGVAMFGKFAKGAGANY